MSRRRLTLVAPLAILSVLLTALFLPTPALAQAPPVSVVEYYHLDALGSVRVVTDQNAQVLSRHDFLPFGEEWKATPNAKEKKLFTGHERDADTGVDYFGARFYRPQVGRFTTPDPIGLLGGSNMYAYVDGNPLKFVDPGGLQARVPSGDLGSKENPYRVAVVAPMPTWPLTFGISSGGGAIRPDVHTPRQGGARGSSRGVDISAQSASCPQQCNCGADYWDRYLGFVNQYVVNVGPYAAAMAGGLWPKSWSVATAGRPPLLGSTNPLTSVPRALGVPIAGSVMLRTPAAVIGTATVGVGVYNMTIFAEGFLYAIPGGGCCTCQK